MCGASFTKSTVSDLCKDLSESVEVFRNRPLDGKYVFLTVEATCFRVRGIHRIVSKAFMLALGINWRTVGNCIEAAHNRIEPGPRKRLRGLRRFCIDETSRKKKHKYITIVYDTERNKVVWVHDKHGQEIFELFCQELSEDERASITKHDFICAGDQSERRWNALSVLRQLRRHRI